MFLRHRLSQRGQGLVETLIAVAVAIIVVTALISLAVFALRNSRQSSYTSQATQISSNQLELLRSYRDLPATTWSIFTGLIASCDGTLPASCSATIPIGDKCFFPSGSTTPTTASSTANIATLPFSYYFVLSCTSAPCNSTGGTVRASVYVTWTVGGKTECIYNNTEYTNWRQK